MRQESITKILTVAIIITLILVIWMLIKLNKMEKEITQNVLSALPTLNQNPNQSPPSSPPITTPPTESPFIPSTPKPTPSTDVIIPTFITFTTLSSPKLEPQTPIAIKVEYVSKSAGGTIILNIIVSTDQANSYSAIDLAPLFALVDLEKDAFEPPIEIKGSFDSLPPQTITDGQIIFQVAPAKNKIILQIGPSDNPKFYEFNFERKTYKEILIG